MSSEAVPVELQRVPQWVVWKYEERHGKLTKVPYCVATGERASTTDATSWTVYEAAAACGRRPGVDGIGFVFSKIDDFVGVDLDGCRDPDTGAIADWAMEIVGLLNSYTEITPSGRGLHILCRGKLPSGGRRKGAVEIYEEGRYFTITGMALPGQPLRLEQRTDQLAELHRRIFGAEPAPAPPPSRRPNGAHGTSPDPWTIVERVLGHPKEAAIWRGSTAGYPSQSEAELALVGLIAFYAGPDPPLIDQVYRMANLWRDKWDSPRPEGTYGSKTIAKALAGKSEFFDWGREETSFVKFVSSSPEKDANPDSFVKFVNSSLTKGPPVALEPEALTGILGDVVRAIDPCTESHPAAVLASLMAGIGCLIGRGPFVYRDGGRLTANEFITLVGMSAKGRKGTGTRRGEEVLNCLSDTNYYQIDDMSCERRQESLYQSLCLTGLGSGEAMIEALADEQSDRRRMIVEEEFSRCLKVMRREGSTLSEALRAAWDGGILANRTKGKTLRARDTHLSILAHITEEEMKEELSGPALYNGFANRFLWVCCSRSKSLPLGGGRPAIAPLVSRLQECLIFAQKATRMEFSDAAQQIWSPPGEVYDRLIARPPALLGAVTSRAEAHVTRLALLYALLDLEREIGVSHLLSALAFWDFCERSCAYLFGVSSGDEMADRIEEALWAALPGGLTLKEIHALFQRNARAGAIRKALGLLADQGKVKRSSLSTPGRPAELWSLNELCQTRTNEFNELSPLGRARQLAQAV